MPAFAVRNTHRDNCRTDTAQELPEGRQASGERDERSGKEVSEKNGRSEPEIFRRFQGLQEEGLLEEKRVRRFVLNCFSQKAISVNYPTCFGIRQHSSNGCFVPWNK